MNPFPKTPDQLQNIDMIYFLFYRSTQPQTKNLSELRSNGDRLF